MKKIEAITSWKHVSASFPGWGYETWHWKSYENDTPGFVDLRGVNWRAPNWINDQNRSQKIP